MRQLLKLHSDSRCSTRIQIAVESTRPCAHGLTLSYVVTGDVGKLSIPPVTAPARSDQLWEHTCFEAFVRAAGPDYYEFNFAPTTQWAAYQFSGYRSGRCLAEICAPAIKVQSSANRYALDVSLQLDQLSGLSCQGPWHLGLSAVIVERSGGVSHWALAHPPGKPDFHNPTSFAHELSPAVQA